MTSLKTQEGLYAVALWQCAMGRIIIFVTLDTIEGPRSLRLNHGVTLNPDKSEG